MKRIGSLMIWVMLLVSASAWAAVSVDQSKTGIPLGAVAHFPVTSCSGVAGSTADSSAIQSQINAAYAAGGGIVDLPPETCGADGIVMKPGVILQGHGLTFKNNDSLGNGQVIDASREYASGSRLLGDGVHDCLDGNNTPVLTIPTSGFGDDALTNIGIHDVDFEGCYYPIHFGAENNAGVYGGNLSHIWLENNVKAATFENFVHMTIHGMYALDRPATCSDTSPNDGGIEFIASTPSNVDEPGNSVFDQIADIRYCRLNKGIRFKALGAADMGGGTYNADLNEINIRRLESEAYGQTAVTATATPAGSGSANFVLSGFSSGASIASFPVGVPLVLTGSGVNTDSLGFNQEYYVLSNDGVSTITLAHEAIPVGSVLPTAQTVATATPAAITVASAGYPNVTFESAAYNGISNFQINAADIEGSAGGETGVGIALYNNQNVYLTLSGITGNGWDNLLFGCNDEQLHIDAGWAASNASTDFCDSSYFYLGYQRGPVHHYYGTGLWAGTSPGIASVGVASGAAAQIGTGGACTLYGGTYGYLQNSHFGIVTVTTGTGTLSAGTLCTLSFTSGGAHPYSFGTFFPMNPAAQLLAASIHGDQVGAIPTNGTWDLISDAALTASTTYEFGWISP